MNQQIFELIQQQNGDCGLLWSEEDKEKFAELVVRGCVRVARNNTPDTEECEYTHLVSEAIKEHFGVEE